MIDRNHAIGDDIAFMRALAEEGRQGPLAGGSILVASGLIFGAASLIGLLAVPGYVPMRQARRAAPPSSATWTPWRAW